MAKNAAQPAAAPRGRGRPRPEDVIQRDEVVFAQLNEPRTKQQIADATSIEPGIVYISLWRLRKQGRVRRATNDAGDASRLWERVS